MKHADLRTQRTCTDVHALWQQQLHDQPDADLTEDLKRREHELLPRFGEYYQRLHALPRRWRRGIGRRLRQSLAGIALLLALGHGAAFAAIINVEGNDCTLADAITAANTDTTSGGCPAGSGADTLNIQNDIILTSELPSIVSGITIEGNDRTIQRYQSSPAFPVLTIAENGDLVLNNATISGGVDSGIRVHQNAARARINHCVITGNLGDGIRAGGPDYGFASWTVVSDSTVSGNSRTGITVDSPGGVRVERSSISDNGSEGVYVTNSDAEDAAYVGLYESTISGNSGDGVRAYFGTVDIVKSTVTGNEGWGMYLDNFDPYNSENEYYLGSSCSNSTISGNSGGGIRNEFYVGNYGPNLEISGCLVSGNASATGVEIKDSIPYGYSPSANDYNLFGDGAKTNAQAFVGFTPGPTDITATSDGANPTALEDILDTTLRDNGGPTKTLALIEGSPAVDAGGPDCPPPDTDQRGFPRPGGGACDIGAFEGAVGLINDRVTFAPKPSTDETTRDKEGCPPNYWGKYLFEAALTNVGGQDLNALAIQIEKLTRKNLVLAPDSTLLGEGDRLSVPPEGAYADWVLGPSEVVNVPIEICLKRRRSFQFFADVYGSVSEGAPGTASLTR